jgi:hypothetical protein
MVWTKFNHKMPTKPGFYVVRVPQTSVPGDEHYVFICEIGKSSFGASSPKGFIYMYADIDIKSSSLKNQWRLMTRPEVYNFYDAYIRQNGLVGLHNLRIFHKVACNPCEYFKDVVYE